MYSSNTSSRPAGCITIPVEIISTPNSNGYSTYTSSFRPYGNENLHSDFSNSPPWERPSRNSNSTSRFLPRHTRIPGYDRLIQNSHSNQPSYDRPSSFFAQPSHFQDRVRESRPVHTSRSTEDLLSPTDPIRFNLQPRNTSFHSPIFNSGFRSDSDFVELNRHPNSFRRSYDALNDFADVHQHFPTNRPYPSEQQQQQQQQQSYYRPNFVNSNEYRVPTNHQQASTTQRVINNSQDRSHSPASQCDDSPARPPPPPSASQQQESDFKVTRDTASPLSKSGTTATSVHSNDQQVPSTDIPPVRDPNIVALEKLDQIKQHLTDFNQQVDAFTGVTRDDRVYKLLDEQALKIMMRCDELTDVSADIKEKRKEIVRNVQTVLAKLESKVPINPIIEHNSNQMETTLVVDDPSMNTTELPKEETST